MDISAKYVSIPSGFIVAIIVTTLLFIALPLLTQIQTGQREKKEYTSFVINQRRPPPPPEPDRDKRIERQAEKKVQQKQKQVKSVRPQFEVPNLSLLGGGSLSGTIKISGLVDKQDFRISDSLFATAFDLTEVDQPPRVLRSVPPTYPFIAKRNNIEGRVTLRFVVDSDGNAQEPEVAEAEPEGVFEEAALKAVLRYKFKPAVKDGENVDCIVLLPIVFAIR